MKNNKKLARNAIRARKAQKKRVNEQDKPIKGKRWFSRLFVLIGCLLLVSALALPCFADTPTVWDSFISILDPRATSAAMLDLMSYYERNAPNRFFEFKTVVSGEMDINNSPKDFSFLGTSWSSNDGTFRTSLDMDYFVAYGYSVGDDYVVDAPTFAAGKTSGSLEVTMTKGSGYSNGTLSVVFYDSDTYTSVFAILYDLTFESYRIYGALNRVYFGNSSVTPAELYDVSVAFVPVNLSENIPLSFFVNSVFSSTVSAQVYSKFVYSPSDFYKGYLASYDLGQSDGYTFGYNEGYLAGESAGYDSGLQQGRDQGFNEGIASSDGFNQGYQKALSEISSGEFGANLLGSTFNAPIRGLNQFVLVTTPNGVEITLGNVISAGIALVLVLAFLKVYAGG